jgi:predicted transcriptional regulator
MEVRLPENQQAQLQDLAARTGKPAEDLVREAVTKLLAEEDWFRQQVQIGIDQIAPGEFLDEEQMDALVERMLRN